MVSEEIEIVHYCRQKSEIPSTISKKGLELVNVPIHFEIKINLNSASRCCYSLCFYISKCTEAATRGVL